MTDYPSTIFTPRTTANKSGVSYDPAKTTTGFAEDYSLPAAEIAAIETELGTLPKGSFADVKARIVSAESGAIVFIIDGGGSAITTGQKGHLEIPFKCEIERATLLADVSGSIVVNIWKDTYANFPPAVGDKITASAPPTIVTDTDSQDATLTGWTKTINAGDILAFNVDSAATITRVTLVLKIKKIA